MGKAVARAKIGDERKKKNPCVNLRAKSSQANCSEQIGQEQRPWVPRGDSESILLCEARTWTQDCIHTGQVSLSLSCI